MVKAVQPPTNLDYSHRCSANSGWITCSIYKAAMFWFSYMKVQCDWQCHVVFMTYSRIYVCMHNNSDCNMCGHLENLMLIWSFLQVSCFNTPHQCTVRKCLLTFWRCCIFLCSYLFWVLYRIRNNSCLKSGVKLYIAQKCFYFTSRTFKWLLLCSRICRHGAGADPGFPIRGFYLFKCARSAREKIWSYAHFVETTPIFVRIHL